MYASQLSLLQLPVIGICIWTDCLRLFVVVYNLILLIMYCMCFPAFFVTNADKSQLWVYLCYIA